MATIAELHDLATKFEKLKQQIHDESHVLVSDTLREFVVDNPQIKQIQWTQYTPYFNDGDTCEFSMNDVYFCTVDLEEDDSVHDMREGVFSMWRGYDEETIKRMAGQQNLSIELMTNCSDLVKALNKLEEALQYTFGDHVEVIVTKQGIEVSEYNHD